MDVERLLTLFFSAAYPLIIKQFVNSVVESPLVRIDAVDSQGMNSNCTAVALGIAMQVVQTNRVLNDVELSVHARDLSQILISAARIRGALPICAEDMDRAGADGRIILEDGEYVVSIKCNFYYLIYLFNLHLIHIHPLYLSIIYSL